MDFPNIVWVTETIRPKNLRDHPFIQTTLRSLDKHETVLSCSPAPASLTTLVKNKESLLRLYQTCSGVQLSTGIAQTGHVRPASETLNNLTAATVLWFASIPHAPTISCWKLGFTC